MARIPVLITLLILPLALGAGEAAAQTTVILPDTSQTTGVTVNIMEQATVTVPSSALFAVSNINTDTTTTPLNIAVTGVFRRSTTTGIRLSLKSMTSLFTPPQVGAGTWSASDVTWQAGTWTSGTGATGALSSAAFTPVATCGPDGCSTNGFVLRLAAKPSVTRSGAHTLVVVWKIESLQ